MRKVENSSAKSIKQEFIAYTFLSLIITTKAVWAGFATAKNFSDYINEVKTRVTPVTQKVPLFKPLSSFNYPITTNLRDPFQKSLKKKSSQILIGAYDAKQNLSPSPTNDTVFPDKHITLNFVDIKIRKVLQIFAEFTGINLVVSDKVVGSITTHLNDIPWEKALNIILTTKSLGMRKVGNIIFIAPMEEITERETKNLQEAKNLSAAAPLHSLLLQINYAKAADIANLLKDKATESSANRGRMGVDTRTNTIWIEDTPRQLNEIQNLVKQLDIPVKQVLIEARIVNVNKEISKDLGLHFSVGKAFLSEANKSTVPNFTSTNSLTQHLNMDINVKPASSIAASIELALATLGDSTLLDLELSALESEGLGKIIASPRIITTNQQTATIESGEEIPYQEQTTSGATSVTFKKAVLSLRVTPQITPNNKILMDLKINQDTLSTKAFNGVQGILTKEIQTKVLVNNGQTLVLGGIYKQESSRRIEKVPFLSRLPFVGVIFKNQSKSVKNEELLLFITPRIITNNLS